MAIKIEQALENAGLPIESQNNIVKKKVLESFLLTYQNTWKEIEILTLDAKYNELEKIIHGLKSSAGGIGAFQLQTTVTLWNILLKKKIKKEKYSDLMHRTISQLNETLNEIKKMVQSLN